jgi:hypothetical protein
MAANAFLAMSWVPDRYRLTLVQPVSLKIGASSATLLIVVNQSYQRQ